MRSDIKLDILFSDQVKNSPTHLMTRLGPLRWTPSRTTSGRRRRKILSTMINNSGRRRSGKTRTLTVSSQTFRSQSRTRRRRRQRRSWSFRTTTIHSPPTLPSTAGAGSLSQGPITTSASRARPRNPTAWFHRLGHTSKTLPWICLRCKNGRVPFPPNTTTMTGSGFKSGGSLPTRPDFAQAQHRREFPNLGAQTDTSVTGLKWSRVLALEPSLPSGFWVSKTTRWSVSRWWGWRQKEWRENSWDGTRIFFVRKNVCFEKRIFLLPKGWFTPRCESAVTCNRQLQFRKLCNFCSNLQWASPLQIHSNHRLVPTSLKIVEEIEAQKTFQRMPQIRELKSERENLFLSF